ncbi:MAG: hypothetical protein B6D63_05175 [Candidatus Latescibacteria bacterium 4484_7]|nr:MAG: hypothetical protein B6D63_05175 [Candidatus Latescibacteria bacterium 4484_7]
MKRVIPFAIVLVLILSAATFATIPRYLSYQGVLTDAGGAVVADGTYSVTFRLYDVASGGTPIWSETDNVQVSKGIFNVTLGTLVGLSLPFDEAYYLSISVEGGSELSPRVLLKPSPYSYSTMNVWGASNVFPSSGYVGIGTKSPGKDLHIYRDSDSQIGLRIENPNTGANSAERISFSNEDGDIAGIVCYDHDNGAYPGVMSIFNNRPDGSLELKSSGGSVFIAKDGNVGIGSPSPTRKLDVAGTVKMNGFFMSSGASAGYVLTSDGLGNGAWAPPASISSDGDWTISGSDMYSAVSGNVGIGDNTPTAKLDIRGGNWDLDNTDGDLKIGDDTYKLKIGVATGGGGAGTAGIRMQGGVQKLILGAGSKEAMAIDSSGTVSLGSPTQDGYLEFYSSGISTPTLEMYNYSGHGTAVDMYNDAQYNTIELEPDYNGTGGYFSIYRNETSRGFVVDGNHLGTGNTFVDIEGEDRSVEFDMSSSGDASVALPSDAISAVEILDEPGGASSYNYDFNGHVLPSGSNDDILTKSIAVPAAGYVLVIATAQVNVTHSNGTSSNAQFAVSDASATMPAGKDVNLYLDSNLSTGAYRFPVTVHGMFSVPAAGTRTFYFVGNNASGTFNLTDVTLTTIYLPTAYGSVSSSVPSTAKAGEEGKEMAPALTSADIQAERAEAIRFNMERIQRELDFHMEPALIFCRGF